MPKPLSYYSYFKSNKRKVTGIILSIAFSIVLLGVMNMYADNMTDNELRTYKYLEHVSALTFNSDKNTAKVIKKIEASPYVEKVIGGTRYRYSMQTVIGTDFTYDGYSISEKDIPFLIKATGQKLICGNYPKSRGRNIIINENTARSRNIWQGGYMGNAVRTTDYFEGKYKVTGIIGGNSIFSLMPFKDIHMNMKNTLFDNYLIVPHKGKLIMVNKFLSTFPKGTFELTTYSDAAQDAISTLDNFRSVFNIVILIILLVLSITLGLSSYVHYFQRRREVGLLKAIGHRNETIIYRMINEITASAFLGFLLGFILLLSLKEAMTVLYLTPKGISPFRINIELIPKTLSIPITVCIFSIIPASRLLLKVEPVSIIERMR